MFEKFKDLEFYMGESCDSEAMHPFIIYDEETDVPYMYFFKHGLEEEKVVSDTNTDAWNILHSLILCACVCSDGCSLIYL